MRNKKVKDFNVSKSYLLFFILDTCALALWRGMNLQLKISFWSKYSYFPELILNYVTFKAKFKYMNI